jgi:hypothetical protein
VFVGRAGYCARVPSTRSRFAVTLILLAAPLTLPAISLAEEPPAPPAPDVTTLPATDATGQNLTLHATAVTNGTPTTVHFEYSPASATLAYRTPDIVLGAGPGEIPVTASIPTRPGIAYFFRAVAENDDWVAEGDVLQATAPAAPQIVAAPATDITYKSATLHVSVVTGGLPVTLTGSVVGASGPIALGPVTVTTDGDVAFPVTGLQAGASVVWSVVATSTAGTGSVRRAILHTAPLLGAPRPALSASKVRYGTTVQVTGAFAARPGLVVALHEQPFPLLTSLNPAEAATTVTDAQGAFAFSIRATRPATYGVTTAEGYLLPQQGQLAKLDVFPVVTATVKRAKRHHFVVSGRYRPTGVAAKASLYRGGIVKVGTAVSTTGRFAFPARALKPGRYEVRVVPAASTGYVRGKSGLVTVPRR